MDFKEYQRRALGTAVYPGMGEVAGLAYTALGAVGEAGEIANKVKKVLRGDTGVGNPLVSLAIADEIGDVLWYLAGLAEELEMSLDDIAEANLEKLARRKERGVLKGSGDDR